MQVTIKDKTILTLICSTTAYVGLYIHIRAGGVFFWVKFQDK